MRELVLCVLGGVMLLACGNSASSKQPDAGVVVADSSLPADASVDAPAAYPAPFAAPPTAVSSGGPVMAHPRFVPVTFSNDDSADAAASVDFTQKVGATAYWSALSEYGVGAGSATAVVALTETAPATLSDADIQTWLAGKLNANTAAWPTPDANTLYVLYYPVSTTITIPDGAGGNATSCNQFGAYHSNITLDASHSNMNVAYAVIPRCVTFGPLSGIDAITGPVSHELVEAATDPFPQTSPAYQYVDDGDLAWVFVLGGGEIGDLCAQQLTSFTKFAELPDYTVQRFWSNASAAAGHDPCVPVMPNEVYFQSAPVLPDMISLSGLPPLNGVTIPVGQSKVISVNLFSDAPTSGPWTVAALDYAQLRGGTPALSFAFDHTTGQNGTVLKLTITAVSAAQQGAEPFIITSKMGSATSLWIGLVGN